MRDYTTLGSGRATKVLAVAPYTSARTVTSCSYDAASKVCHALKLTDRQIPAALHGLAVHLNGEPVEARRHLLNHFDRAIADPAAAGRGELWGPAETLITGLASAVRTEPAPTVSAVRAELESHLQGFDGVLVPATAIVGWNRRSIALDLVISGPLHWLGFWDYLFGPHGDVEVRADDARAPQGAPLAGSTELDSLLHELFGAESYGLSYGHSIQDLFREGGENDPPELLVRADYLLSWVTQHAPQHLDAATEALTAEPAA